MIPLVDSGRETGLEWVELMEMYRGKGLYLLCQLPLIEKYGTEPMAREMLSRMLRYTGGKESFRTRPPDYGWPATRTIPSIAA